MHMIIRNYSNLVSKVNSLRAAVGQTTTSDYIFLLEGLWLELENKSRQAIPKRSQCLKCTCGLKSTVQIWGTPGASHTLSQKGEISPIRALWTSEHPISFSFSPEGLVFSKKDNRRWRPGTPKVICTRIFCSSTKWRFCWVTSLFFVNIYFMMR